MKIRGSFRQEISSSKFCAGRQSSDLFWFLALGSAPSFRRIAVADIGRSTYVTRRRFLLLRPKETRTRKSLQKGHGKIGTQPAAITVPHPRNEFMPRMKQPDRYVVNAI
jgi:hypothetical protein